MHSSDAEPLSPSSPLLNGEPLPPTPTNRLAFASTSKRSDHNRKTVRIKEKPIMIEDVEKQPFEETVIESMVRRLSHLGTLVTLEDGRTVERRKSHWILPYVADDERDTRQCRLDASYRGTTTGAAPSRMAVAAGVGATVGLGAGIVGCTIGLLAIGPVAAVVGGAASAVSLGAWAAVDASTEEDHSRVVR